ncbi:Beta,beta-carotene 15,15'-monooxygenase [Toxocara canis]|uniref:Beta,beta-carotene 15,15'-monooxygenase n=1 Tax=Toxocara canis TaxID=6265 RepID=A0A0B2VUM8_TOXCA|nr:Beta,beta-carotene 15,15'-monooxygenase [Toxocara canis]
MPSYAKLFENFVDIEQQTLCDIKGKLPTWLKGTLFRNGPGMFSIGDHSFEHLFDGLAYIQRYHFENGKAFYNAKFLRSDTYKRNIKANRIVATEFGTKRSLDPTENIFRRFVTYFEIGPQTDNTLINILQCGDNIYATTEVPWMHKIDVVTLDSLKRETLKEYVNVDTVTAHQHYDEEGNIYNIGTKFGRKAKYIFFKTPNPKFIKTNQEKSDFSTTTFLGEIKASDAMSPTYYHSFAMTSNYMILFESSLRIHIPTLLTTAVISKSYRDAFRYTEGQMTVVQILNHKSGKVFDVKIFASCFFTFHHANAYEKDEHLFIDYVRYDKVGTVEFLSLENMRSGKFTTLDDSQRSFLYRMIIPLNIPSECKPGTDLLQGKKFAGKCRFIKQSDGSFFALDEKLCEIPFEFPRYNYNAFNAKPYRFVYGAVLQPNKNSIDGLVKVDVEAKTTITWKRDNELQLCTEPVFVESPNAVNEDDGILLCPVLTTEEGGRPFILVVNAKDMSEAARCYVNCRLPFSFHGHFVHSLHK